MQAAAHGAIRRRLGGMQTAPDHDVQDMMSDLFETITALGATYGRQSLATTGGPPAHSYLGGGSADWVLLISSLPPVSPQVPLAPAWTGCMPAWCCELPVTPTWRRPLVPIRAAAFVLAVLCIVLKSLLYRLSDAVGLGYRRRGSAVVPGQGGRAWRRLLGIERPCAVSRRAGAAAAATARCSARSQSHAHVSRSLGGHKFSVKHVGASSSCTFSV